MWCTYVLKSSIDGRRYIGSTNDLSRRIKEHNTGVVKSTRSRRPLNLIYSEEYMTEAEARSREHFFKTHKGYNELRKLY